MSPSKRLQPRGYHAFRCIGADCEDTCCAGWIVNIDKPTYQAYQQCGDADLGPRLREVVTINPASSNDESYARISLNGPHCPFLTEGLCEVQNKLGEGALSLMCSQFPRVMNVVDDVLQRSLDLSCPEAARVMLLDPNPIEFDEEEGPAHDPRLGNLAILRTTETSALKPYEYFREIRAFIIWLLQYRSWPLWKRLVVLGSFCDELEKMMQAGTASQIPEMVQGCRDAMENDLFGEALRQHVPRPQAQLELALEWIVARITSDFTHPRFLACYQEFMQGIQWTSQSSMEEISARYAAASSEYFAPFLSGHEHMLEHYLVSYVHRTLFPLGPQEGGRELGAHGERSIREQCLLLLAHFAVVQTLLVGMAAYHKGLTEAQVIRAVQAFSKTFEHSLNFPGQALGVLAGAGVDTCLGLALTIRN